jgi:hypothetical protein
MTSATLLPFQPDAMTPAQLAAVSYLARYTGQTHTLYGYQLHRWFTWSETNGWTRSSACSGPTSSSTSATSTTVDYGTPRSTPCCTPSEASSGARTSTA